MTELYWVPRGYMSKAKIKEDDIRMIKVEDIKVELSEFIDFVDRNRRTQPPSYEMKIKYDIYKEILENLSAKS